MYKFSQKSLQKLNNPKVHPIIKLLMNEAIKTSPIDFSIIETVRTVEQQKVYIQNGTSKTMKSRHIPSTNESGLSEAVDIIPYPVDWNNIERFKTLAAHIKSVANKLKIQINWGGDWRTFKDYPHFELRKNCY